MRLTRKLVWYLAVLIVGTAWAFTLRPQSLGGPAGYVMVRGVSMLPTYHTNDLVITRPRSSYAKGDIVAYRVPKGQVGAGIVVIHRIIGGSGRTGYLLQGDNNPAPDDWRPKSADIVGKAWILGPQAGKLLLLLHAPIALASVAAGIAIAIVVVPQSGNESGGEEVAVLRVGGDVVPHELAAGDDRPLSEADVVEGELDEAPGVPLPA
jgi:signal peptidase